MNLETKKGLSKSELVCRYRQFILDFGPGFHPDNSADEYTPELTEKEQIDYNNSLDIYWAEIPELIYEIGVSVFDFIFYFEDLNPILGFLE